METLAERVAVVTGGASGHRSRARARVPRRGHEGRDRRRRGARARPRRDELAPLGETSRRRDRRDRRDSVDALADATYDAYGACHVLCNNAGVGAPSSLVWETTVNDWRWVHGVNVMGVVHGIQAFVPRMIAAGEEGYVVNTSSGDGGIAPMPTGSVYAASKAAVTSLTECLAVAADLGGNEAARGIFYPSGGLAAHGAVDRGSQPSRRARARAPAHHRSR